MSIPTNDEPSTVEKDLALGRHRIVRTTGRNDDFLDCDDLPNEDDLLSEVVVPEAMRLKRLQEIQEPFKDDQPEPYMSSCVLAAKTLKLPISLMSLVYDEFQWFKAKVGIGDIRHSDRCWSFCAHTFTPERPEVLYVPDSLEDDRFCDNELVHNNPNIRFYTGVPLVTQDGVRLGALCVIDKKPRVMCKEGFQFLINLAELTVRDLLQIDVGSKYKPDNVTKVKFGVPTLDPEKKFRRIPRAHKLRRLRELWFEKGLTEGVLLIDVSEPRWSVAWANSQWNCWTKHAKVIGCIYAEIWSVLRPMKGETGSQMQSMIVEKLASNISGRCSFLARVDGLDGSSSVFVSCEVTISSQPIKGVSSQILMPTNAGPANAEPISFDGNQVLMMFVSLAPESLESEDALMVTSFQDEQTVAAANMPLEADKASGTVVSGEGKFVDAIPKPHSSPSRPPCPNRNRVFHRPSDAQVQ